LGLVAKFFEVVIDLGDGLHAWVVGSGVVLASVFLVPIEDATNKWADKGDLCLSARDRLMHAEEQRHVAVDALALEDFGSLDALPGRGKFDEHPLARNAC